MTEPVAVNLIVAMTTMSPYLFLHVFTDATSGVTLLFYQRVVDTRVHHHLHRQLRDGPE